MSLKNILANILTGYSEEELAVIADNQRSIKEFIGSFPVVKNDIVPPLHASTIARMAEYNITLEEGQNLKPSQFNLADLKFRLVIKEDEKSITGEEMRQRAVTLKGNLGLADVKNLLDQLNSHSDKRKDLQSKYIVLPRTLLRGSGGDPYVAVLRWGGAQWVLNFCWIGFYRDDCDRFACCELARNA